MNPRSLTRRDLLRASGTAALAAAIPFQSPTQHDVANKLPATAFPARPLKPADAKARARMRGFTKFIDAAIFPATATVSQSIAFHHQYKPEVYETMEKARPGWLANFRQLQKGTENPAFPAAIKRPSRYLRFTRFTSASNASPSSLLAK